MTKGRGGGKTPERLIDLLKKAVSEKSQSGVARATGLTQSAIHRYMKGIGEPSGETLQILADFFEVQVPWLQGFFENMSYEKAKEYKIIRDSGQESGWAGDIVAAAKGSVWQQEDALDVLWEVNDEYADNYIEENKDATRKEIRNYLLSQKQNIFVEAAKRLREQNQDTSGLESFDKDFENVVGLNQK